MTELEAAELQAGPVTLAHLTGTSEAGLPTSASDAAALRRYVEAGGTLLIDVPGRGAGTFARAAGQLLAKAFPGVALKPLPASDLPLAPLLPGMESPPQPGASTLRPFALLRTTRDQAALQGFTFGHGRVLFAPVDLTSGLLGTNTWGITGYTPDYAQSLLENVLLTAAAEHESE